ncbi:DNA-binding Lrp family transcriptional regulator [Arthrobacter pigmenti]|uniref:DNA-binding Lrp family transcriptional regulator n=1 Tax=Arthrobacter pigmenti TaxID=271432 RepID=A0A846REQ1_9MICC|nr:Lrp/AsnC family transcriptional regulator [Arthrobacter pigmenti]NJC21523.1 DNA-binding Lrp family transcriptional regulator [Arthrobacter pigmenti]
MTTPSAPRLDELDRCILSALQIHGRASWQQIARAAGTSDSTVSRRVNQMLDDGLVQVIAATDPLLCDEGYPVLVQITSRAGATAEVARELAIRPDVRFAALVTGSFDVVVELIVRSQTELCYVLFNEIERIPGVWSTTTESVVAHYKLANLWLQGTLPRDAVAQLESERGAVEPGSPRPLDERERALVDLLTEDARASFAAMAQRLGTSESGVRRRLDALVREGRVHFSTIVDPEHFGYTAPTMYWLHMELRHVEEAARILTQQPDVRYVAATAGYSDLAVEVVLRDQQDLHRFNMQVLGELPGLRRAEAGLELATLKRAFVLNPKALDLLTERPALPEGALA